jgi:tight adherence protein B
MRAVVLAVVAVLAWPSRSARLPSSWSALADVMDPQGRSGWGSACRRWARARGLKLRPRPDAAGEDTADLVEILLPCLQAGVPTAAAVEIAAQALGRRDGLAPLVDGLLSAAGRGAPLGGVWEAHARRLRLPELAFLAQSWTLSEEAGVSLTTSLATVSRVLRARQAAARSLAAATAGPRASMTLLSLLPVAGPAVGLLFGVSPLELYGSSPAAALSLALGVLLGLGGWAWSRAILHRARQPEVVS